MRCEGRLWAWAALTAVGLALGGCGDNIFGGSSDDDSTEARVEKGVAALNSGNWAEAQDIFGALYDPANPNPEVTKYLASAYVGEAGFDTLSLVEEIAKAQDGGSAESIIYEAVTGIFDTDGDGLITQTELGDKADLLAQALEVLIPDYGSAGKAAPRSAALGSPTDQEKFQAGLYAAAHAVLAIVAQLEHPAGSGRLVLTLDSLNPEVAGELIDSLEAPSDLDRDLALVADAAQILISRFAGDADKNDIAAEFDNFLSAVGYGDDDHVSTNELRNYLRTLLDMTAAGPT